MISVSYKWGQSGKPAGETDYNDCGHPGVWLPCFNTSVFSTNQNGMLLVLAAYITEVQRQSSGICSSQNVVQLARVIWLSPCCMAFLFQYESVSTNQIVISLGSLHYCITGTVQSHVQCSYCSVATGGQSDFQVAHSMVCVWCVPGVCMVCARCVDPSNRVFQKFLLQGMDSTAGCKQSKVSSPSLYTLACS